MSFSDTGDTHGGYDGIKQFLLTVVSLSVFNQFFCQRRVQVTLHLFRNPNANYPGMLGQSALVLISHRHHHQHHLHHQHQILNPPKTISKTPTNAIPFSILERRRQRKIEDDDDDDDDGNEWK